MSLLEKEELIGLLLILIIMVGLELAGHLTHEAVSVLQWVGGAFMSSKGLQGLLPERKN